MQNENSDLSIRLLEFGASPVNLAVRLNKTVAQRHFAFSICTLHFAFESAP
jgi:hypothetical protein